MKLLNAILLGYGKMGKQLEALAERYQYRIVGRYDIDHPFDPQQAPDFDIAFDFSHPAAVFRHVEAVSSLHRPMVIGTTGWYEDFEKVQHLAREAEIGILYGRNFSIGVQAFLRVIQFASRIFDALEQQYDVFIHEIHHRAKADSPSGTALEIAEIILDNIAHKREIVVGNPDGYVKHHQLHLSSSRGGFVPGEHTVFFDSEADTLELRHRARNRSGFAVGALLGGWWIIDKIGCYDFSDVFEEILKIRLSAP